MRDIRVNHEVAFFLFCFGLYSRAGCLNRNDFDVCALQILYQRVLYRRTQLVRVHAFRYVTGPNRGDSKTDNAFTFGTDFGRRSSFRLSCRAGHV